MPRLPEPFPHSSPCLLTIVECLQRVHDTAAGIDEAEARSNQFLKERGVQEEYAPRYQPVGELGQG